MKIKKYPIWRKDKKNLQNIDGGWHFSYLMDPEKISEKIKSFSHGEDNIEENTEIVNIKKEPSISLKSFTAENNVVEHSTKGICALNTAKKI